MFGKLQGNVEFVGSNFIILTTGGVGFKVFLPAGILARQTEGKEQSFWVETIVREDSVSLIGFEHPSEQDLFVKLMSVSGIGPKLALAVVGAFKADVLASAIASNDVKTLSSVPGVGKKVAERIIVELRGKVAAQGLSSSASNAQEDALSALEVLGYKRTSCAELVQRLIKENPDDNVQSLITKALREYAGE